MKKTTTLLHRYSVFAALALTLSLIAACAPSATQPDTATRRFTLLAINDVYRLDGVNSGRDGGLARVRTLRSALESQQGELLFLHAGDFLYPSLF